MFFFEPLRLLRRMASACLKTPDFPAFSASDSFRERCRFSGRFHIR